MPTSSPGRYGALLHRAGVRPLIVTGVVARLPVGMAQLGLVLLLRGEGWSYADAGIVVATYTICLALAAPVLGRAVDRLGLRRVLLPVAVAFPAVLGALVALTLAGAPLPVLAACGALAGATLPPIEPCVRALWPMLAPTPELRTTAYALEATVRELVFISGPLIVSLTAALASPAVAMALAAGIAFAGTIAFASTPAARRWRGGGTLRRGSPLGALASRGVRTVMAATLAMGAAFGSLQVSMPAFAEDHGSRSAAGLAIATFATGSLLGGLIAGALPAARRPARRFVTSMALFAAGLVPLLATWSIASLLVATLLAGLAIAPTFAAAYGLVDDLAPPNTVTEAFSWMGTSLTGGFGLGTALGGIVISASSARVAQGLAVGGAALAAAVAAARRASLERGPEPEQAVSRA